MQSQGAITHRMGGEPVLRIERHKKILNALNEHEIVKVSDLAAHLDVTEETIRRDLEALDNSGSLKRIHGGAVPTKFNEMEQPFAEREVDKLVEKNALAKKALELIATGDSIALDASTTALQLAKIIPNEPRLVLTYSLSAQLAMMHHDEISILSCGGRLLPHSLSLGGPTAEKFVEQFHVDKLFMSCRGLSIQRGISDANDLQAHMKQKLMSIADQVILLIDASKFDKNGFALIGSVDTVDTVITESIPAEYKAWLERHNVEVIEAPLGVAHR